MANYSSYQKKGKTFWEVQGYLGIDPYTGKQRNFNRKNYATKKDAKLAYDRALYAFQKGEYNHAPCNTFEEVYRLWLKSYKLTVKESSYVKLLQKFDKHILPAFRDKLIKKITVVELQTFANHMREINTQYKEYISNVSRIFTYAIKLDLMDHNPVKKITIPKKKKNLSRKEIKFFTKEELKKLLAYTKEKEHPKVYTFFYLMANTGTRTGELLGLEWRSVDFENKCIHITQTLSRGQDRRLYLEEPKTMKSKRTIPINESTVLILKQWRKSQMESMLKLGFNTFEKSQLVFSNYENSFIQLTQPRLWLKRITKRAGLPDLSPHSLRHTFATLLISQNVNFKNISDLLGHESVAFTADIYGGTYQKDKEETINLIEAILK